jgi:hypothetical protein
MVGQSENQARICLFLMVPLIRNALHYVYIKIHLQNFVCPLNIIISRLDKQVLQELLGSVLIQQVVVLAISSQIKIPKRCSILNFLLIPIFFDLILMS